MTMSNSPAVHSPGDIIESVIAKGDLAKLSPEERTRYYVEVCKSVGLNPLTKPMEYITLNGRMVLYALRNCTDQLRTNRGVSVEDMTESEREGVYVVTCKVKDRDGRTDMAKGAVSISGLKGEALANAIMKCETKAKRRATLSICGLGMLDESELETIPSTSVAPASVRPANNPVPQVKPLPPQQPVPEVYNAETGEVSPHEIAMPDARSGGRDYVTWGGMLGRALNDAQSREEGEEWLDANAQLLNDCQADHAGVYKKLQKNIAMMRERLPDFMPAAQ